VIANLFSLSTATDTAQLHGRTRWLYWPAKWRLLFGKMDWRWQRPGTATSRKARLKRFLSSWWSTTIWVDGLVVAADALRPCFCERPIPEPLTEEAELVESVLREYDQDEEHEVHFGLTTTTMKRAGFVVLHLVWGVFAWIIFAYGRLVYNLLGPKATADFTASWGIGIGMGQVSDMSDGLKAALEAVLIATILESLWLRSNSRWLENYTEFASILSVVPLGRRGTLRGLIRNFQYYTNGVS